jgi:hypothetical protein
MSLPKGRLLKGNAAVNLRRRMPVPLSMSGIAAADQSNPARPNCRFIVIRGGGCIWMKTAVVRSLRVLQYRAGTLAVLNLPGTRAGPRQARKIAYVGKREPRFTPACFQGEIT